MTDPFYLAIALSALVTVALRAVPILLLARFAMPRNVQEWLSFVPAAIMAAIIAAELIHKPAMTSSGLSLSLLAAFAATLAGIASRSLFVTVIAGVLAFLGLQALLA